MPRLRLSQMGCDLAQGYLYAPPMPVAEFMAWWESVEAAVPAAGC